MAARAQFCHILRAAIDRTVSPRRSSAVSLVIVGLAAYGDIVTHAQATFALFYVVALALAVWHSGLRFGYLVAALSVTAGILVDFYASPRPSRWYFIGWNNFVDAALYAVLAHVLWALRQRLQSESRARLDAVDQLRHAERLNTLGKLASGIAHEIGSPLNVVSGYAELLVAGRIAPEEISSTGQVLLEQTERVSSIVRQLLDFARRAGTQVIETEIDELAVSTAKLLDVIARKSGVEIVHTVEPTRAAVNRSEIQQVLMNLLTNAIQAMPTGGRVFLRVRPESAARSGPRNTPRHCAVITVRDSGTGIAPQVLPSIFDPFFTTKEIGQGTGLGLSVAYGIVKDHGGWITVSTRVDEGTTFSVFLPCVPEQRPPQASISLEVDERRSGHRL